MGNEGAYTKVTELEELIKFLELISGCGTNSCRLAA
jgi:hypothetical protein